MDKQTWIVLVIGAVLGAIVSMPIQIAVGLVFPSIQRRMEARLKKRAFAKSRRMREDYLLARHYRDNPHEFTQMMLRHIYVMLVYIVLLIGCVSLMSWFQFVHTIGKHTDIENIVSVVVIDFAPIGVAIGFIAFVYTLMFMQVQVARVHFFKE